MYIQNETNSQTQKTNMVNKREGQRDTLGVGN